MSTVQESVDVDVPVSVAYNQWTQFETFPEFMDGVESITQVSDTRNHWVTKIGGAIREFDTEISEQHPTSGSPGTVSTVTPSTPVSSPSTGSTTTAPG